MTAKEHEERIEYSIGKLTELLINADMEDKKRGKKRYVSKVSAYKDIIKLLKEVRYE